MPVTREQLAAAQARLDEIRRAFREQERAAMEDRDKLIRQAVREGVPRAQAADAVGLSREQARKIAPVKKRALQ